MRHLTGAAAAALLAAAGAAHAQGLETPPSAALAAECPRDCLESLALDYLDALAANDPSRLSLTDDVRFTENGVVLEVGDALWRTADGVGTYANFFTDPEVGQVGVYHSIREHGEPAMLVLRLKREPGGAISQIEHIVIRSAGAVSRIEASDHPEPVWNETVPEAERLNREQLARAANAYFSSLENQDGQGVYPFTEDCNRLENGSYTTNSGGTDFSPELTEPYNEISIGSLGCREQFETGYFALDTELHGRRFPVIDIERQKVFGFIFFDHDAKTKDFVLADGSVRSSRNQIWTWQAGESFKIVRGELARIEAWLMQPQYHADGGWDEYDRDYYGIVDAGNIGK